jgi:hypothetical protein
VKYGFPLQLLRCSLNSYAWPRRLLWHFGLVADGLCPSRGVAAGSGFAQHEVVLYLMPLAFAFEARLSVELSIHIDDLSIAVVAPTNEQAIAHMSEVADEVRGIVQDDLLLQFDDRKANLVASDAGLLSQAGRFFGTCLGRPAGSVRRLGFDYCRDRRHLPKRNVQAGRIVRYKTKLLKARLRLGRVRGRLGPVFTAQMQASLLYGVESVGLKPLALKGLRVQKLRAMGAYCPGVSVDAQWLRFAPAQDPGKVATWLPLGRLAREWWLAMHAAVRPRDCLTPKELVQAHRLLVTTTPGQDEPLALIAGAVQA